MKINEPKTPYTRRYDPSEDLSDDEDAKRDDNMQVDHQGQDSMMTDINDIPGLDLGEPVEALPPPDRGIDFGSEFGGRIVRGEEEDGEGSSTSSSRPSTRGRRDSTKQVVVEEVVPEKEPEPDGKHLPGAFLFYFLWVYKGGEADLRL